MATVTNKRECNMDCFHCPYPDCIHDGALSRQHRYYLRNREKCLAQKREAYWKKKGKEKKE